MTDAALDRLLDVMRWALCGQWLLLTYLAPRGTVPFLVAGIFAFALVAWVMERPVAAHSASGSSSSDSGSTGSPVLGSIG